MSIPLEFERTYGRLSEALGPEIKGVLDRHLFQETLQQYQTVLVVRPWRCYLDLKEYGYADASYRILDAWGRLRLETFHTNGVFGIDEAEQRLLWNAENGEPFVISFATANGYSEVVVVCQNELTPSQKRALVEHHIRLHQHRTWTPREHEITLRTAFPYGHLRILYLPGDPHHRRRREEFFVEGSEVPRPEVEINEFPLKFIESWYPKKSGWYTLQQVVSYLFTYHYCVVVNGQVQGVCQPHPFPNSTRVAKDVIPCTSVDCRWELPDTPHGERVTYVRPLEISALTGIGTHRLRLQEDGVFYLDPSGQARRPTAANPNLTGIGIPQVAADPSLWLRLEAKITPFNTLYWTDQDEGSLHNDENIPLLAWEDADGLSSDVYDPELAWTDQEQGNWLVVVELAWLDTEAWELLFTPEAAWTDQDATDFQT